MTILFCTVGGSHQPILTSIGHHAPEFVWFVCSADDPVSGKKGSYTMIRGEGKVISSKPREKPDLQNIPSQLGLGSESYEVISVPTDDPTAIMETLLPSIREAVSRGRVIADYTGGTKSMSIGLFLAALQVEGVELSQVSGPRLDLVRVINGHETTRSVDVTSVRERWMLEQARLSWKRHDYAAAAMILGSSEASSPEIVRAGILSRGFDAWDRFDHRGAYALLQPLGGQIPRVLMPKLSIRGA